MAGPLYRCFLKLDDRPIMTYTKLVSSKPEAFRFVIFIIMLKHY